MKNKLSLQLSMIAALSVPAIAQDARIAAASTNAGSYPGFHGQSVTALSGFAGGAPAYAVAAPLDDQDGASPQAGQVRIFRGNDGSLLRQIFGSGSATSCSGATIVGDRLGETLVEIGDLDGDGLGDLLATRRGAGRIVGSCLQAGYGGFRIMFSNNSWQDLDYTPTTPVGLGVAATALADGPGGLTQFAVTDAFGHVHVFRQESSFNPAVTRIALIDDTGQLGSAIASAGTINGVAAFAINVLAGLGQRSVHIKDINDNGQVLWSMGSVPGSSSNLGRTLEYFPDPISGDALVIGDPSFSSDRGRIHFVSIPGLTELWTRSGSNSGDALGSVLSGARDIDADGNLELLASQTGGQQLLIIDRFGVPAARPIQLPDGSGVPAFATSIAVSNDLTGDGFADVVVGSASSATAGQSWVYYGGPEARSISVGSACSQPGSTALASLAFNAVPVIGTTISCGVSGASPSSASALLGGTIDPIGTVLPGSSCSLYLATTPAPVNGNLQVTDSTGSWGPQSITIPSSALLLGQSFGFQAVTISSLPGSPLELSNAVELVIGW